MRLLVAAPEEKVRHSRGICSARIGWTASTSRSRRDRAIARAHGIDPAAIKDDAVKKKLFAVTDAAAARGVFGVPTFFVE
jgi:hypothetical protein